MTEELKIKEIITLLSFLQLHIKNNVKATFNDLSFTLETFIKDYLNVFENENEKYFNVNEIISNFPAIDLINKEKKTVIQITTNADLKKVKKTIKTYTEHKLKFDKLIIIGFVKNTKSKIDDVEIYGIEYLINLAKFGTFKQKEEICDILHRQIPLNILNPLDDKMCLEIVFDVINRSAVRDYTSCEGNFEKMVDGLIEIKEIITTGTIKNKPIRAKALVEYSKNTKEKLSDIEFDISNIIQICNRNKNSNNNDFVCLKFEERDEIDNLKEKIMEKTNELVKSLGITKQIIKSRK